MAPFLVPFTFLITPWTVFKELGPELTCALDTQVPAQSSERWDFYLAQQTWQGGAQPAALTPLHFANSSSFNPHRRHHPFQKAFPARVPTPTPPTKQGKGPHTLLPSLPSPTCHSTSPAMSREEMLCLCVGLFHQLWAPRAGIGWLRAVLPVPKTQPSRE